MKYELLKTVFKLVVVKEDKIVKHLFMINKDFIIMDTSHAADLIKQIEILFWELSVISRKGYINDPNVNLPIVLYLVKEFGIVSEKELKKFNASILLNTLYYNLILLALLRIVIEIENKEFINDNIVTVLSDDQLVDLKNIRKSIMRMIHPNILDRIRNRGLTIVLNSITGFDSEYEIKSSHDMTNELLSVQLASNSNMYVKVPLNNDKPSFTQYSIKIDNDIDVWGEDKHLTDCGESINLLIQNIRSILFSEHDKLIEELKNLLETVSIKSVSTYDHEVFYFPHSGDKTFIKFGNTYSSEDLIRDSDKLNNDDVKKSLIMFIELLNIVSGNKKELSEKMLNSIDKCIDKPTSRISYKFGLSKYQLLITINRVLYLCMHESAADLSMLSDFDEFKNSFDIIARSFVTRSKALVIEFKDGTKSKSKVHFRDTILIAPMGAKSLAAVGSIYGPEYHKIDIGNYRTRMSDLLRDDKALFERYAIMDSRITLKHARRMERYYFTLGKLGVPLTISGISKAYVLKQWSIKHYEGYQVSKDIMVGNLASKITPKDARAIELSKYILPFIRGYRGGRNESIMYGVDVLNGGKKWYDYDLTSAYTTVMSILGHPDTEKAVRVFNKTVENMSADVLIYNYIILEVTYKFDKKTKYPCIPTRVDDNVDIYPLEGSSTITGLEYLVAKSMGCHLVVKDGIMIPFKRYSSSSSKKDKDKDKDKNQKYVSPFSNLMKVLQEKRRKFPKKTFYNYLYKEIGNSIYGQVAMGISGKKSFDVKTNQHLCVEGGALSNPILASYITGFTRALVGECMNNIQKLGGNVVSVTTDGFITDIDELENKLLTLDDKYINLFKVYRRLRKELTLAIVKQETSNEETSNETIDPNKIDDDDDDDDNIYETSDKDAFVEYVYDDRALEIKNTECDALASWKTRGQLGKTESGISAATGFQSKFLDREFLWKEFSNRILNEDQDKKFDYTSTSLRSATDVFNKGGHVIVKYKDQYYSLEYDNKRRIIDAANSLLDSSPWNKIKDYQRIRLLRETVNVPIFTGFSTQPCKNYKSYIETGVRAFIKACLSKSDSVRYGIPVDLFDSYNSLIEFIYGYEEARIVKLTPSSISNLKDRKTIARAVPRTRETELFIEYIKTKINTFNSDLFFREFSDEVIKARKKTKQINK